MFSVGSLRFSALFSDNRDESAPWRVYVIASSFFPVSLLIRFTWHCLDFLRAEVMSDMFNYDNPALVTEQNAIMRYAGIADTVVPNDTVPALDGIPQDLNTSALVPIVPSTPPAATRMESVFVTFQLTAQGSFDAFFNGTSWEAEKNGNATVFQTADATIAGTSWSSDTQFIITNDKIQVFDLAINKSVNLTLSTENYSSSSHLQPR